MMRPGILTQSRLAGFTVTVGQIVVSRRGRKYLQYIDIDLWIDGFPACIAPNLSPGLATADSHR